MIKTQNSERREDPVTFNLSIPWDTVEVAYRRRLDELTAKAQFKGFRKGKAPKKLVEEKVGKKQIMSEVVGKVLPGAYQDEVKKRGLVAMISPRVKPVRLDEKKDWEFEITVVEKPKVELENWQSRVKDALAPARIIKPGEEKAGETTRQNEKVKLALDALLKAVSVDLPSLLVDEEVNLRLSKLIDQVQALGMTVDQYLQAKGLTQQRLRSEYEKTAREVLVLNLGLDEVARQKGYTGKDRIAKTIEYLTSL